MTFKLKGNKLISADIISPEIPYAVFDEKISRDIVKKIVCNLNYGFEVLMIYKEYRDNMHIKNVTEMLERIENIYQRYNKEIFLINRDNRI